MFLEYIRYGGCIVNKAQPTLDLEKPLSNIDVDTIIRAYEASRSPLIITDYALPDNPIIYSNQAFIDLIGYGMSEVIGKNCRFLQGEDTDPETIAALRKAVKAGDYIRVTIKNYKKDGTMFWNDLVMSPIKDSAGKTTHFMGMQLDITDRVESAQHLQDKTRELELANGELEQFTYAVSHDLQEPLRMISSYLQLIMKRYEKDFNADVITFMNFATEGAERLQELIYDLLSLSRVSTTQDKFKKVSLKTPIDRALLNLKASIEESGAKVIVGEMPTLSVDAVQMTQLFQNLIGNAIKYRKPDIKPVITIDSVRQADNYVFSVADNGIGIDKKFHERVFGVFQRLHTKNEYKGTGVGLAICSKIIDRHNGKIWVESEQGNGSKFFFSLPERITT